MNAMPQTTDRKKSPGFTLVELLVVVAIIALLISILLPALNQARAVAQSVTCKAQLNQVGLSFRMYANDNADFIAPFSRKWTGNWSVNADPTSGSFVPRWFHYLQPYVSDYHLFNCQVMDKSTTAGTSRGYQSQVVNVTAENGHPSWVHRGRSEFGATSNYAYQSYISFLEIGSTATFDPTRYRAYTYTALSSVAAEAGTSGNQLLFVMDGVYQVTTTAAVTSGPSSNIWYTTTAPWRYVHPSKSANALIMDGHVATVRTDSFRSNWIDSPKYFVNMISVQE